MNQSLFNKNLVLENDRVLLRPLDPKDSEHLMPFAMNEPTLWAYSLLPANGVKNMTKYLDFAFEKKESGHSFPFIVFDKASGHYAGSTRFYDIQPQHNTVQLGYTWYGSHFQGTGLNKNCKLLMLTFAFELLGVERVEFRADAANQKSIVAMKSIGCKEEGILRSNCAAPKGRRDSIVLSILKEEWFGRVKKTLEEKVNLEN
ncbi:MAG: RimJ/RimL family protein N-acetyltransferase [Planctomycetota bacterium]|jgi:RimJ/RimL family protein N-acetyltransferase|uniref:GNAT family N-acetyltransferase n=1 Tax=Patiriisocius sp. Uisw_047 TaxID=3230969 RepID=UPI0039E7A6C8